MKVLGIETSCDDTGVAVFDTEAGLLAHLRHSQMTHAKFGGVVPELASRDHSRKILPLIEALLAQAGVAKTDLDGVAYTAGPGLIGALFVGASVGRSLSLALNIPSLGVHHMEAHLMAAMLEGSAPAFPFLALLVSGGHTLLVEVKALGDYTLLGSSLDDAAGEAFDKTAKLLNLGYPGGPALAAVAATGDKTRFRFPRPMTDRPGLDLSFSGLKTFTRNLYAEQGESATADIAAGFEYAVVETLRIKCERAVKQTGFKRLVVAGGVGANLQLREGLLALMTRCQGEVFYPRPEFCTDNGAMVAYLGALRLQRGEQDADLAIRARARWPLTDLV